MAESELWVALGVAPITDDAIRARSEMWGVDRRSHKLGLVPAARLDRAQRRAPRARGRFHPYAAASKRLEVSSRPEGC